MSQLHEGWVKMARNQVRGCVLWEEWEKIVVIDATEEVGCGFVLVFNYFAGVCTGCPWKCSFPCPWVFCSSVWSILRVTSQQLVPLQRLASPAPHCSSVAFFLVSGLFDTRLPTAFVSWGAVVAVCYLISTAVRYVFKQQKGGLAGAGNRSSKYAGTREGSGWHLGCQYPRILGYVSGLPALDTASSLQLVFPVESFQVSLPCIDTLLLVCCSFKTSFYWSPYCIAGL